MIELLPGLAAPEPGGRVLPLDLLGIVGEIFPALTVQTVHVVHDLRVQGQGQALLFPGVAVAVD